VTEFVDGQTLSQWMIDNPGPDLETVRGIVEQIAKGLQAFHRLEMLHQDLRPDNVMIDRTGTAKIIDFGSVRIAGIADNADEDIPEHILGTAQYTAPEYFIGEGGSQRSDIFSLGVIAYQMLTGRLPYGAEVARTRTRAQQKKLRYRSLLNDNRDIPAWVDGALKKAVHPDPYQRYDELSEFVFDLRHPNKKFLATAAKPLIERDPLLFWKCLSAILFASVLILQPYSFCKAGTRPRNKPFVPAKAGTQGTNGRLRTGFPLTRERAERGNIATHYFGLYARTLA
jgi:serine/threonine protein kinase